MQISSDPTKIKAPHQIPTRLIRSFGRIKSRKLSTHKEKLLSDLLPKYLLKIDENSAQKISAADFSPQNFSEIYLEIGFGFGDFLFTRASLEPDIFYIGCETHINGIVNVLAKLEARPLQNLKIFQSDIRLLLEKIPDNFLAKIFILFPDPWPKAKHYKRRLINRQFLQLLRRKMKSGSELIIATDHSDYKKWIMNEIFISNSFDWTAKSKADWQNFPASWITTKYQKKAALEGRESVFLKFISK